MKFWAFFILFLLAVLGFKWYISKGVWQATASKPIQMYYTLVSGLSFVIGITTLLLTFPKGINGLSFWQNFAIGWMLSLLICELILFIFFVVDDLGRLLQAPSNLPNEQGRRHFLKTAGLLLSSLPLSAFLYGITKGKYNFRVLEETLYFPDLPEAFDGFRILQFSDLHAGGFDSLEAVTSGFELINAQKADLILFTGDLVNDLAEEILPYKHLLEGLSAPYGKFSVLGNHDYSEDDGLFPDEASKRRNFLAIQQHQKEAGFSLLNNTNVKIEKGGAFFRLIGVENWGNGFIKEGDLDKAVRDCGADEFSVLMSHDPSHWEKVVLQHPKHIHLTLSGHTHGMQMGIEVLGIKWSPIQYVYKHWAGLYETAKQYLYVNRGFGFMAFAGRVGIAPEITVFSLKRRK